MHIKVDLSQFEKLQQDLGKFAKKAVPAAAKNTLNALAFEARREWVQQVGRKFVLRNKFTVNSLRVTKATGYNTRSMESRVGSVAEYMGNQETGFTERAKGKHGVAIPTSSASGQAKKAARTKQVRKSNYLSAIQVAARVSGRRQRKNAVAIRMGAKTGGVAFLDLGGKRKGLFRARVTSKGRFTVRMLYDLSKKTVAVKPTPTLEPALERVERRAPAILEGELIAQLKRFKVAGY